MNLRVCSITIPRVIDEVTGVPGAGDFVKPLIDFGPLVNLSLVFPEDNRIGRIVSNKGVTMYDGCIGSVQRNESDFALVTPEQMYYGPGVRDWLTASADYTVIGSSSSYDDYYLRSNDVGDFSKNFSLIFWILLTGFLSSATLLMTSALIMSVKRRFYQKQLRSVRNLDEETVPLWRIMQYSIVVQISCIMRQRLVLKRRIPGTWLPVYAAMFIASLFFACFIRLSMKTEAVDVVGKPSAVISYEEILERGVRPVWFDEFSDEQHFRNADDGSAKRRIWDRAVMMGLNESVMEMWPRTRSNQDQLIDKLSEVTRGKSVTLSSQVFTKILISNLCAYRVAEGILRGYIPHIHKDDSEREYLKSIIGSAYADSQVRLMVTRRFRRVFETDPPNDALMRQYSNIMSSTDGNFEGNMRCMSNSIGVPLMDLVPMPLFYYKRIFFLCGMNLVAAAVAFIAEMLFALRKHRTNTVTPEPQVPRIIIDRPITA